MSESLSRRDFLKIAGVPGPPRRGRRAWRPGRRVRRPGTTTTTAAAATTTTAAPGGATTTTGAAPGSTTTVSAAAEAGPRGQAGLRGPAHRPARLLRCRRQVLSSITSTRSSAMAWSSGDGKKHKITTISRTASRARTGQPGGRRPHPEQQGRHPHGRLERRQRHPGLRPGRGIRSPLHHVRHALAGLVHGARQTATEVASNGPTTPSGARKTTSASTSTCGPRCPTTRSSGVSGPTTRTATTTAAQWPTPMKNGGLHDRRRRFLPGRHRGLHVDHRQVQEGRGRDHLRGHEPAGLHQLLETVQAAGLHPEDRRRGQGPPVPADR